MNLDFASVWETIADIVPENDALICGDEVVSWKDYDLESSKIATRSPFFIPFDINALANCAAFVIVSLKVNLSDSYTKKSFSP